MNLFNEFNKKNYGGEYRDHLLEQYKILVESAEKVSDRRNLAHNFYLGVNTAIITLVGLSTQIEEMYWIRPLLYLTGVFLAVMFWFLINSYIQLNSGKFKVIHEIEEKLPLSMYKYEWEVLGEGKDKTLYFTFTHVELWTPKIFGVLYFILLIPFIIRIVSIFRL